MKTVLLAFLALLLFSVNATAQFDWQKTYGPFANMNLSKMIALRGGGYLLGGIQFAGASSPFAPGYLVRTNANGDTLWTKKHLVSSADYTLVLDVIEDFDGNFVCVGEWANTGNPGQINYNGFIYKLDSSGDTLWTRKIATPQLDRCSNIIIGHDSTYLISTLVGGISYVQKISKNGSLIWNRSYTFSPTDAGWISYLHPASVGYFAFVRSGSNSTNYETKIYKINESGVEQYSKKNKMYMIYDVVTEANQNLLVCSDGRLFKLNPTGDTIWSKIYKKFNKHLAIKATRPTSDGKYITLFDWSLNSYMDVGLMKVKANGDLIKDTVLVRGGYNDYAKDIVVDANGDYVFAGYSGVQNGEVYFLCKYRKWNQLVGIKEDNEIISSVKLYPNPATEQIIIESEKPLSGTLSLYNLQGQKLWQETVWKSTKKVIPLQHKAPGVYILRFVSEDGTQFSRKIVKHY
jgi:hypothetical protein